MSAPSEEIAEFNWTRTDSIAVATILLIFSIVPLWYIFSVESYLANRFENDIELLNAIGYFLVAFASISTSYVIEIYLFRKQFRDNYSKIQSGAIAHPRECEAGNLLKIFWMIAIPFGLLGIANAVRWYTLP